jgi:hypothetical protein
MNPRPRSVLEPYRTWLEASRSWSDGVLGAQKVLAEAVRRSTEEARAVLDATNTAGGTPDLARLADLSRAGWFLWAGAGLTAAEISGRGFGAFPGVFPAAYSPRALVLGTVAADLYSGYAALRRRSRLLPDLVADEDWELQHRRGAARVLDAAETLGGVLIKAGQFASTRPDLLPHAYIETLASLQDRARRNRTGQSVMPWPASWASRPKRSSPLSSLNRWPPLPSRRFTARGYATAGRLPSRSSTRASPASSRRTSTH